LHCYRYPGTRNYYRPVLTMMQEVFTTYSVAGADYGYSLDGLVILHYVLWWSREMNARMGIVTGKRPRDLIARCWCKVTFFIFVSLLMADMAIQTTEFAGVAGSMEISVWAKYISVPICIIPGLDFGCKGTYKIAERIFSIFSASLLVYIVSAIMGKPHWSESESAIISNQKCKLSKTWQWL